MSVHKKIFESKPEGIIKKNIKTHNEVANNAENDPKGLTVK
jgi:hypothetical protein